MSCFFRAVKRIMVEFLSVLLAPFVAIAIIATFSIVTLIFLPYYLTVALIAKLFRPDLTAPIFGDPIFLTTELPQNNAASITNLIPLDGIISTEMACKLFIQRVVEKKNEDKNELLFYRYRHTWTRFLGLNFWQLPRKPFRAEDHVREYDLDGELELPSPCGQEDLLKKFGALSERPWMEGRSPWEFLVIQDYRTESEPGKPRTALLLRHHHGLIDGYGVMSVIRELSQCPCTLPKINFKASTLLTKMYSYSRIPYDISKELTPCLFPCLSRSKSSSRWPVPSGEMGALEVAFSEPIKVETIRRIKNQLSVSFLAVNLAISIGALKRLLLEQENVDIPAEFPVIFPVPKPNHPGGTNVHFTMIGTKLPLLPAKGATPVELVLKIEKELRRLNKTSRSLVTDLLVTFTSFLPILLQKKVFRITFSAGPMGFSSFPGHTDLVQLEGKNWLELISCLGSIPSFDPTILVSGTNGNQRIAVTVNTANRKLRSLQKLKFYAEDELRFLLAECTDWKV